MIVYLVGSTSVHAGCVGVWTSVGPAGEFKVLSVGVEMSAVLQCSTENRTMLSYCMLTYGI